MKEFIFSTENLTTDVFSAKHCQKYSPTVGLTQSFEKDSIKDIFIGNAKKYVLE